MARSKLQEVPNENWIKINSALTHGSRGLRRNQMLPEQRLV